MKKQNVFSEEFLSVVLCSYFIIANWITLYYSLTCIMQVCWLYASLIKKCSESLTYKTSQLFNKATVPVFNSFAPGKFEWNFRYVIFKRILAIDGWGISCEIALVWMPMDFTDDQSTLVQVMVWCRQATSHYLSQCWPSSMSPYGVTRPQWIKPHRRQ